MDLKGVATHQRNSLGVNVGSNLFSFERSDACFLIDTRSARTVKAHFKKWNDIGLSIIPSDQKVEVIVLLHPLRSERRERAIWSTWIVQIAIHSL